MRQQATSYYIFCINGVFVYPSFRFDHDTFLCLFNTLAISLPFNTVPFYLPHSAPTVTMLWQGCEFHLLYRVSCFLLTASPCD